MSGDRGWFEKCECGCGKTLFRECVEVWAFVAFQAFMFVVGAAAFGGGIELVRWWLATRWGRQ